MSNLLPPLIDITGAPLTVRSRLYEHFSKIFKCSPRLQILGKPLVFDSRIGDDNFEMGFWHIITKGKPENRNFDSGRACRICWIEGMLDGTAPGLTRWSYIEGDGSIKVYFWLESAKYVLILADRPNVISLVTAFYIDQPWLERDLRKRRQQGTSF